MIQRNLFNVLGILTLIGWMTSCVSTETVNDPNFDENAHDIVVTLAAPADFSTRASSDHKLRYVAKLFKANDIGFGDFVQRKDLIDGSDKNTIKFKVAAGNYKIMIFADYIPSSYVADESGIYPDCYYNTSSTDGIIEMKDFTAENNPVNNDNYDCFFYEQPSGSSNINKTEGEAATISPKLKRAVAKIRFIANGEPDLSDFSLSISSFDCFDKFEQASGIEARKNQSVFSPITSKTFSNPSSSQDKELFYFYSFSGAGNEIYLKQMGFKVTNDSNQTETIVNAGTIRIKRNYVTTVSGSFAYVKPQEEPGEIKDEDCIILNSMTVNDSWDNNGINSPYSSVD